MRKISCIFCITACALLSASCSARVSNLFNFMKIPNFSEPGPLQEFKPDDLGERTTAVILVHGLMMNAYHMAYLAWNLSGEGYYCVNYDYPTRLKSIQDHGRDFAAFLEDFHKKNPERNIFIVTHSMGGLVTRHALAALSAKTSGSIKKIVMLSPPNQGSIVAWYVCEHLTKYKDVFRPVPGLSNAQDSTVHNIPAVPENIELCVLSAKYDFLVPEYSTHMQEESEHKILPQIHMTIPYSREAVQKTLDFFAKRPASGRSAAAEKNINIKAAEK